MTASRLRIGQFFRRAGLGLIVGQQRLETLAERVDTLTPQVNARAFEGFLKTFPVEGFEQVVERMHVESLQGVLVVGRHEDDHRHLRRPDGLQHRKAIGHRHLHVEKD